MSGLAATAPPLAAGPNRPPSAASCSITPFFSQPYPHSLRPDSASFPGSPPLRSRNPAPFCRLTTPPLLKVGEPQSFVLRRSAPASRRKFAAASSNGRQGLRTGQYQFDDDEPLWLAVVRDFAAGLRSLVAFLADQPRQLKHLEWPGFQNTLRTSTLTLILVAVFIVALSSVDAALSYILSWLLRKSA